ncbi:MAG: EAL domain-containing protein [Gammaproteobacteria bacterium]|nr:EAL domain-containing protein [Gammaproteobacteria bacterium]
MKCSHSLTDSDSPWHTPSICLPKRAMLVPAMAEVGLAELDGQGCLVAVNGNFARLLGRDPAELVGTALAELMLDDDAGTAWAKQQLLLVGSGEGPLYARFHQGEQGECLLRLDWMLRQPPADAGLLLAASPLAGPMPTLINRELAAKVIEHTQEGVVVTDGRGHIQSVNPAFEITTGYSLEEVVGYKPSILKSGCQGADFYQQMFAELAKKGFWQGEIWNRRKNGEIYPEWLSISAIRDDAGRVEHYVGIFTDIGTQHQVQERLRYLAYYDGLTRLPNRALFFDRLQLELAKASRDGGQVAVLFMGLDRFSHINESLGHGVGDRILQQAALRIQAGLREGDSLCRMGGDEFSLLLVPIRDAGQVSAVAEKLRRLFTEPFHQADLELYLSLSIGISLYPDDGVEPDTLVKHASTALDRAKELGRDNYQFYTRQLNQHVSERLVLEQALRQAVEQEAFSLAYQPQVDVNLGRVIGAEALLRWHHPTLGWVRPDLFIPLAEELGLINPIGDWVLRQACCQMARWLAQGWNLRRIAVNLSPMQLRQRNVLQRVHDVLGTCGLAPEHLELELTEGAIMGNVDEASACLSRLSESGIQLAIDDFGTGYSSLAHLKRFAIDKLKIDRSFVSGVPHNANDGTIVATIISMARSLKLSVIAEGVETGKQLAHLQAHGCYEMQGYLFGKPMSAAEIEALFDRPLL